MLSQTHQKLACKKCIQKVNNHFSYKNKGFIRFVKRMESLPNVLENQKIKAQYNKFLKLPLEWVIIYLKY